MAILKTKANPDLILPVGSRYNKVVDSIDQLVRAPSQEGYVLPGIKEDSVHEDSALVTLQEDDRESYTAIADSAAGVTEVVQRAGTNRRKILSHQSGSIILTPFGITNPLLADGTGLDAIHPRVGLPLPSTKLKVFYDWDDKLFDNYAKLTARQITMSYKGISQGERLTAFVEYSSVLGFYQAMLNKVKAELDWIEDVGTTNGTESMYKYLINDEDVQKALGEITQNLKNFPVIDNEYHEMISELCKWHFAKPKSFEYPCVVRPGLFLGTTAAAIDLDAVTGYEVLPIENTDSYWNTTFASLFNTDTSLYMIDRIVSTDYLVACLFNDSVDATMGAAIKVIISSMVTHTSMINKFYKNVIQYITFAESKKWITQKRLSEFLAFDVDTEGGLIFNPAPITYSHTISILNHYFPRVMHHEQTNNNAWNRFFCPILMGSNGHTVETKSTIGMLSKIVSSARLIPKHGTLDELASWGLWMILADESTAQGEVLEHKVVTFVNPITGMVALNQSSMINVSAAGAVVSILSNDPYPDLFAIENNYLLNGTPTPYFMNATGNFTDLGNLATAANTVGFIRSGESDWMDMLYDAAGLDIRIRMAETDAGTLNYVYYILVQSDDTRLIRITSGPFKRAAASYYAQNSGVPKDVAIALASE